MGRAPDGYVDGPHDLVTLTPARARAFLGLVRAGELLDRRLDADLLREHGIGLRAYEVLLHLAAFAPDGDLRMGRLIAQTPLSQSRVSRLVAQLEQDGLVRRTSVPDDARAVRVAITDAGIARLRAAQPTHHDGLERLLFDRLSDAELTHLGRITAKLLRDREVSGE